MSASPSNVALGQRANIARLQAAYVLYVFSVETAIVFSFVLLWFALSAQLQGAKRVTGQLD